MTGALAVTRPDAEPAASGTRPVVVVDLGGQYARLIARRLRELGIYSEIVAAAATADQVLAHDPVGIILSGGPASVNEPGAPGVDSTLFFAGVPVLGICYGMQLMAERLGGSVGQTGSSEYGRTSIGPGDAIEAQGLAAAWLGEAEGRSAWMSHKDTVTGCPEGFQATAHSPNGPAVIECAARRLYGIQFHPEVVHTDGGLDLLRDFAVRICGAQDTWTASNIVRAQVEAVAAQVGTAHAVCALSGGVDSAVAAALAHRALGDQLTCVFVDHGLLRAGEAEAVVAAMREHMGINVIAIDASARFMTRLAGVTDPEHKRRIIGEEFIRVFEETAESIPEAGFLVQGTLYSDVVESGGAGTGDAATIKSHHNVGGLPADMGLELVEPLRTLFKDEVRAVGRELGLPDELVERQPFPGPGLAIRIVGEVTPERRDLLAAADAIVRREIAAWEGDLPPIWQAFAVLPIIRSVGVQGDGRTYAFPIVLRVVDSDDAMTADWVRLPYGLIERISNRITNEVDGVNRVLLDVTSKPPGTIEWE